MGYALDDIIVCVMRGSGFTALEQTIMDSGDPDRVVDMREEFQRVVADRYKAAIEELTGRKVLAARGLRRCGGDRPRGRAGRRLTSVA